MPRLLTIGATLLFVAAACGNGGSSTAPTVGPQGSTPAATAGSSTAAGAQP